MAMWTTGLHLLGANTDKVGPASKRLEYLRTMMLRNPEDVGKCTCSAIGINQLHCFSVKIS